jgi:hypothetical protein
MIDTIGLDYLYYEIPKVVLKDKKERWAHLEIPNEHEGWINYYAKNVRLKNGAVIRYEYYPFALAGKPFVRIILSLPNVVFGNNYQMIFDIESAVEIANQSLPVVRGIPHIDLWKGEIVRLDVCYNHHVGHLVPYFVRALQSLEYERRETLPYSSEGVSYGNDSIVTYF